MNQPGVVESLVSTRTKVAAHCTSTRFGNVVSENKDPTISPEVQTVLKA